MRKFRQTGVYFIHTLNVGDWTLHASVVYNHFVKRYLNSQQSLSLKTLVSWAFTQFTVEVKRQLLKSKNQFLIALNFILVFNFTKWVEICIYVRLSPYSYDALVIFRSAI